MTHRKRKFLPELHQENLSQGNLRQIPMQEMYHPQHEAYIQHYLDWFHGLKGICTKFDDICVNINPDFPHAMRQWENDAQDINSMHRIISDNPIQKKLTINNGLHFYNYHKYPTQHHHPYAINTINETTNENQPISFWAHPQDAPMAPILNPNPSIPYLYPPSIANMETFNNPNKETKPCVEDYEYLLNFPYKNQPDLDSPEDLKMDIPGVYWTKNSWIASWYQNKKRHYKSFSAKTHGFYKAKFWAIKVRLMQESKPSVNVKNKFKI